MKLEVFAVKDTIQGQFMNPFYLNNEEEAKRAFAQAVNCGKDVSIANYYKDMQLYKLGTFDTVTGELTTENAFLINGIDVKECE